MKFPLLCALIVLFFSSLKTNICEEKVIFMFPVISTGSGSNEKGNAPFQQNYLQETKIAWGQTSGYHIRMPYKILEVIFFFFLTTEIKAVVLGQA